MIAAISTIKPLTTATVAANLSASINESTNIAAAKINTAVENFFNASALISFATALKTLANPEKIDLKLATIPFADFDNFPRYVIILCIPIRIPVDKAANIPVFVILRAFVKSNSLNAFHIPWNAFQKTFFINLASVAPIFTIISQIV